MHSERLTVGMFEAPSLEALQGYSMEPEIMAMNMVDTTELKLAVSMDEGIKMFQQPAAKSTQ